jgi:hypothetical protein
MRRNLRGYAPQLRSFRPIAHQHSPTRAIAAQLAAERGELRSRPPMSPLRIIELRFA